ECRSPKDSRMSGAAEPQRRTVPVETSTSNALVSQCDESDCETWPPNLLYDRFLPSGRYHAVPPPYTETFMLPKPDFVFNIAPTAVETEHLAFNVQLSPTKPEQDLSHITRPTAPIIKDWVCDSEDESETKAPQFVPSFVQSSEQVKTPRHSVQPVKISILTATPTPASLKSASSGKRQNRKDCFVCKSMDHLIKDYDYHAKKMAQPTLRNYAHRENKPNVAGSGPTWLFDIDSLTRTMNYQPNNDEDASFDGKEHDFDAKKPESEVNVSPSSSAQSRKQDDKTKKEAKGKSPIESFTRYRDLNVEFEDCFDNSSNEVNAAGSIVHTVGPTYGKSSFKDASQLPDDPDMPELEDITCSDDEDVIGAEADFNNLETSITIKPIPTTRIYKDHPVSQIIDDLFSTTQTRSMTRVVKDQGGLSQMFDNDFHTEVYVCQPLEFEDPDYPDKVYKVVKALYGLHQAPRAWYETLANYLLENGFQRGKIDQTLFIKKQKGLQVKQKQDGIFISQDKYVAEILRNFGLTDGKSASTPIDTEKPLLKDPNGLSRSKKEIFCCQDKYVAEILRKFRLTKGKSASTPIDTEKPFLKDPDGEDVDVHTYRSMIGSLMYLTSSRPEIMFSVCACACFQVTPKASHLHAVKRIFRYHKGKPHLGLWYSKDSPFDLVAYSDNDYAGASLNRKSTTEGCQFLRCRLISWQCKKQTVVATSSTEAEYVAAASCCAQVLWIQNQLLDYGPFTIVMHDSIFQSIELKLRSAITSSGITAVEKDTHLRVRKGFSGVETPLFEGMLVGQEIKEGGDEDEHDEDVTAGDDTQGDDIVAHGEVSTVSQEPSIPSPTPSTPPPQPPQDLLSTSQVQHTPPPSPQAQPQPQPQQAADFPMSLLQEALDACAALTKRVEHLEIIDEMDKDDVVVMMNEKEEDKKVKEAKEDKPAEVQEVVDVVTIAKLIIEVVTAASGTVTATSAIIPTAKPQVPTATITVAPVKVTAAPSRKRKGVVIRDPEEESTTSSIIPAETKSKDKVKGILVEEPKPLKKKQRIEMDKEYARKYQAIKRKPQTEAQAQKNIIMYLKNVNGFKLDYFKGITYDDIRLIFKAKFNSNVDFLLKSKEKMEEEESRALQTINETPAEKADKRRKLNEEVEDLKRHLEIVPNKDDDVYTEATPLARKVPVVDYEIIEINNKPYYKIIRADGTHQLYISFLTLLKNFNREDLEALWNLVKERFSTSKPKNFSDDFLLTTLGAMFEKPNALAQV
nr:hypothetical protein [Tanacetum cinerariifolium]